MRRLLAIVLAAGPLAAAGQTTGLVTFSPDATINASECASTSTATLQLAWTTTVVGTVFLPGGSYAVYAANKDFGTAAPYCYTADDTASGTYAAKLATDPTTIDASLQVVPSVNVNTAAVVDAAGMQACTADGSQIYVCVQWTNAAGTISGYAKGSLTLKVAAPAAPTVDLVWPGDKALVVDLADNGGSATATTWRAKAVNEGDANDVHYSSWGSIKTGIRIDGLQNGIGYTVTAFARSDALNESPESSPYGVAVKPQPVLDAWGGYKAAGGRDAGGCDSGPAGLLAFLGAASLLGIRRRS